MTWKVEWDDHARKELRKLDHSIQAEILGYLRQRIVTNEDPRRFGRALSGDKNGLWRYRISTYNLQNRRSKFSCCNFWSGT